MEFRPWIAKKNGSRPIQARKDKLKVEKLRERTMLDDIANKIIFIDNLVFLLALSMLILSPA